MNKKWKLLFLTMSAFVLLTACTSNKITSDEAEQAEKQASEQAAGQKDNSDTSSKETNPGVEDHKQVTPENLIATMTNGSKDAIYNQFTPEMKQAVSLEDFKLSADGFLQGTNAWKQVVHAEINGLKEYAWIDDSGTKGIRAYFTEDHQIGGLNITPLESYPDTDNKLTQTEFQFPMKGDMFIFWGGHSVLENYHYEHVTQRYALDIVRKVDGASYQGDAKVNANYYAFGQPLYAAADGTVVEIKNDIEDNVPGVMNPKEPAGNYVVINHGNGEYSITGHIKKGSVAVKKGDKVKQGDLIGDLGNSGNSSEAHLHFQVSDGPDLFTSRSLHIRWADQSQNLTRGNTVQGLPE
ncbi:peptidase M23-like protein [Paenibacillus barcinonensis]|nr:M23 family metallopeptidase [Paenibacillus barcinonensis]PYE45543.1 peptidase M23-like protein [Paenibacillus barcinonensis]